MTQDNSSNTAVQDTDNIAAVTTALVRCRRLLATFELYARNFDLETIGTSEPDFGRLVACEAASAEDAIQAAMDLVDGDDLTRLDNALDAVRRTRQLYFTPMARSAALAYEQAQRAESELRTALCALGTEAGLIERPADN
jgi:hypothetical protein